MTVSQSRIPPPLKDSPKCPRCALVTVCLPDEVRSLSGSSLAPRTIAVPPDEALPLIVQSQHARIGKEGETLKITDEEKGEAQVRFIDISDVALFGNVSITTPALAALLEREIPVTFHSHSGWFRGVAHGIGHRNVEIRTAQYRLSFDEAACLRFAKELVAAKITNQRTILRRNWRGPPEERQAALDRLGAARKSADGAAALAQLLGVEGDAAAVYFRAFAGLLKSPEDKQGAGELAPFRFEARNRRPPTDPVNAMLSLAYAMLTRHLTIALASVGLDPYRGFYHAPRYGRPALALDLMEPFRAIIADSVVLSAVNTGEVGPSDFVVAVTGTALTQARAPPLCRGVRASSLPGDDASCLRLSGKHAPHAAGSGAVAVPVSSGRAADLSSLFAAVSPRPMADERLFIVTYDISDQKRWRRVFKAMHGYGEWIQLSVFQCRLSQRRRAELETRLRELVKNGEDHVLLIDVGPADKIELAMESIGKTFSKMERRATVI